MQDGEDDASSSMSLGLLMPIAASYMHESTSVAIGSVQGDANTAFKQLATLVNLKFDRESSIPSGRTSGIKKKKELQVLPEGQPGRKG